MLPRVLLDSTGEPQDSESSKRPVSDAAELLGSGARLDSEGHCVEFSTYKTARTLGRPTTLTELGSGRTHDANCMDPGDRSGRSPTPRLRTGQEGQAATRRELRGEAAGRRTRRRGV